MTPIADEDVPLANTNLGNDHGCCVLQFLLMLISVIVFAFYTDSRKKRQARIFELTQEIETENRKRGLGRRG